MLSMIKSFSVVESCVISSEVVSISGVTAVDLRSSEVESNASVDNVFPSNAVLDDV